MFIGHASVHSIDFQRLVQFSEFQESNQILNLQVCRGYLAKASTESWMALGDGLVTQCSVSLQNSFGGLEEPAKYVISKLRFGRG